MSSDRIDVHAGTAIAVDRVSKKFRLFDSPRERLAEALHPFRKRYHREHWALRDVSFTVGRGEIVGILGENGSGKSTLLQIVCGVMQPTSGSVSTHGRISALLELGAGFNPEFTGRANVILQGTLLGIGTKEMARRLPAIEAFADVGAFFDQPVKTYSSGMFVRVAFASAIHVDPEILIVDEALSVGDAKFQHRCFQRIRDFVDAGKTILVVSHSADTLLRLCHRGIVLDRGRVHFAGPIAAAVNAYQELLFGQPARPEMTEAESRDRGVGDTPTAGRKATSFARDHTDRVATKPSYNGHETRLGDRGVTIIDYDVLCDGVVEPVEIRTHGQVELILKLLFHEDLDAVSAGFAIVSVDGTYISGTNLAMMDQPLLDGRAGDCLLVRFAFRAHIAGGDHFLNLGCNRLADGADRYLDVRRSVATLRFAPTPSVRGFVDLEVTHSTIDTARVPDREVSA